MVGSQMKLICNDCKSEVVAYYSTLCLDFKGFKCKCKKFRHRFNCDDLNAIQKEKEKLNWVVVENGK